MTLVSIIVVTYNHELYIREALQSIVDQKVNFNYEVIVANDASTDGTLKIIQEFEEKYPEKFVIQNNEKNLGVLNNVVKLTSLVKGKYFAILDGDDYWIYEHKLQTQIDFLENHMEYNGVFHDAKINVEDNLANEKLFFHKKLYSQSYFYQEEIHASNIVNRLILPSGSAVFRTNHTIIQNLSLLLKDSFSIDWKLSCLLIKDAKYYYFNEPWSVYRNHNKGISKSNNDQFHLSHIEFLKGLLTDKFYRDYKYDIYNALTNEFKILLNSKISKLNKRKLFRNYLSSEIQKIRFYRKQLFSK